MEQQTNRGEFYQKGPSQGVTAHIWTADQPAGLQHTLSGCMWASLPKAGTERRQQHQQHPPETTNTPRGLFVVVLTFFSQHLREGRIRGRGREKEGQGWG